MRFFSALLLLSLFKLPSAKAQETLPRFTASLKPNGKVVISWKNAYPAINQISIQRSTDSLRNFTTLMTVPDPHIPENGFVDSKAQGTRMFYRLFILFRNSKYMFTQSKRAVPELLLLPKQKEPAPPQKKATAAAPTEKEPTIPKIASSRIIYLQGKENPKKPEVNSLSRIKTPTVKVEKTLFVKRRDSLILRLSGSEVRRFSDSLLKQTRDTLLFVTADTLLIRPYIVPPVVEAKEVYKISPYVYTGKDGNVTISLLDWNKNNYSVRFFDEDHNLLLEVRQVKDPMLIIDKTNFLHSGWFRFELYEDGRLKEKNKLFIPRD